MNNAPLPSPADRLTDLSLRLSEGADAWGSDNEGRWLVAPLIALIVGFIKDIAESLARLAALIRDGKLVPQPPSAPRQGSNRPAGQSKPASRSPWPVAPESAPWDFPLPEPEVAETPAVSPVRESGTQRPNQTAGAKRPAASPAIEQPPACQTRQPSAPQASRPRVVPRQWPRVHPSPKMRYTKPTPWHVQFVTITK